MMWRLRAGLLCFLCLCFLSPCSPQQQGVDSKYQQVCKTDELDSCGKDERCEQIKENEARCTCLMGYTYEVNVCTKLPDVTPEDPSINFEPDRSRPESEASSSPKSSFGTKFLIVPTCLILVVAVAYFGARRYKLLQRFRQFRQNRYGSVLVTRDDTDEDDVPQLA